MVNWGVLLIIQEKSAQGLPPVGSGITPGVLPPHPPPNQLVVEHSGNWSVYPR